MRRGYAEQGIALLDVLAQLNKQGLFGMFSLHDGHMPRIRELMVQYNELPMDLADASLVLLAERLGDGRIVSTDQRDFRAYRWKNQHPFVNLLTP